MWNYRRNIQSSRSITQILLFFVICCSSFRVDTARTIRPSANILLVTSILYQLYHKPDISRKEIIVCFRLFYIIYFVSIFGWVAAQNFLVYSRWRLVGNWQTRYVSSVDVISRVRETYTIRISVVCFSRVLDRDTRSITTHGHTLRYAVMIDAYAAHTYVYEYMPLAIQTWVHFKRSLQWSDKNFCNYNSVLPYCFFYFHFSFPIP